MVAALVFPLTAATAVPSRIAHQAWSSAGAPMVAPQPGEVYVSAVAGTQSAATYVEVDTTGMTLSTLNQAEVHLTEGPDTALGGSASMRACALRSPLDADGEISNPPPTDCGTSVPATRDSQGTWTVPLGKFAAAAATSKSIGVGLVPAMTQAGATFRLAFVVHQTRLMAPDPEPAPPANVSTSVPPTPLISSTLPGVTLPTDVLPIAAPQVSPSSSPNLAVAIPPTKIGPEPVISLSTTHTRGSNAASSFAIVLLVAAAAAALTATGLRLVAGSATMTTGTKRRRPAHPTALFLFASGACVPLVFREAIVYKAGVVLIFFVAALGLHLLVNWAGELSLAHASMVGLPAFVTLALSDSHSISPIYLLPVALAVGASLGGLVAIPALRAKGVQVALVTLVAGIGLNTFFSSQHWLVGGAGGRAASVPMFAGIQFRTSRSLYPVLLIVVAAAITAAWMLMHSKLGRGWFWVQAHPDAAAAFGIPVGIYRVAAYAAGGAFGGLAGGLLVMWIQRLGPDAFPATLSFSYLLVAVLSGPGFVGGLAVATFALQGGQQFAANLFGTNVGKTVETVLTYGGALALIDMIARHERGLNGLGRRLMERTRSAGVVAAPTTEKPNPARRVPFFVISGVAAIAAGFTSIALAWHHVGRTDKVWVQNQEILSGGVGGLGLIIVGTALLIVDRLGQLRTPNSPDQALIAEAPMIGTSNSHGVDTPGGSSVARTASRRPTRIERR